MILLCEWHFWTSFDLHRPQVCVMEFSFQFSTEILFLRYSSKECRMNERMKEKNRKFPTKTLASLFLSHAEENPSRKEAHFLWDGRWNIFIGYYFWFCLIFDFNACKWYTILSFQAYSVTLITYVKCPFASCGFFSHFLLIIKAIKNDVVKMKKLGCWSYTIKC